MRLKRPTPQFRKVPNEVSGYGGERAQLKPENPSRLLIWINKAVVSHAKIPKYREAAACTMRQYTIAFLSTVIMAATTSAAAAQSIDRGATIARANCARCHSIEKSGPSPFAPAPPFRALHERYPVEMLEEALAEGIFTGHPAMPEIQLDPEEIGDFIAFLRSLQ